jgi:perosamine synthetase
VMKFCQEHSLALIEDAACALGATYFGQSCGSFGDLGVFSFHPRKSITTGEGGFLCTSDDQLAQRISLLRSHGGCRSEVGYLRFEEFGYNFRMSDINAAVGRVQLKRLTKILAQRRTVAGHYQARLTDVERIRTIPGDIPGRPHTFQSFVVLLDRDVERDQIIRRLRERGVETTLGTYAMHSEPAYRRSAGEWIDLPNSLDAASHSLTLPLSADMSVSDVDYICEALESEILVRV